jgi:hypothetical protein
VTHHTRRGRSSASGAVPPCAAETAFTRAASGDYFAWLDHIWPAAGCTSPVRLRGIIRHIDTTTGELLRDISTGDLPDGLIYKACGNRRTTVCPSCAETYRQDAYQVVRSGLTGGHGVPGQVAAHPAVFATFTAPSFGSVHTRIVRACACADKAHCTCRSHPCHARRDLGSCPHGRPRSCYTRHRPGDPQIGQPLCLDCYDHDGHVVWNNAAGELWRRTKQAIERYLGQLARRRGVPPIRVPIGDDRYRLVDPVRVSHGKAAEYQARGAVHFHALLRLDGYDPFNPDQLLAPPAQLTAADLEDAARHAAAAIGFRTEPHPARSGGWLLGWGTELDARTITLPGTSPVTDAMVARYLAKYATKGTEITGHNSRRLDAATISTYADPAGTHVQRLIHAAWTLGEADGPMYGKHHGWDSLRQWAHMLGFGGHFLTTGRRYSITFQALRDARITYQRAQSTGPGYGPPRSQDDVDNQTTLILNRLTYAGTGWQTSGDALLASTAADQARRRRQAARDEKTTEDYQAAA